MLEVWDSQQCIASSIFLLDKMTCSFYTGASYSSFQNKCPNEIMIWEAIRILHERGYSQLCMNGLAKYKSKYGPGYAYFPVIIFSKIKCLDSIRGEVKKLLHILHLR